jgi:hypothetical protein
VAGKTQLQVLEACKAAAAGTLWASSPEHSYGTEDPNLQANIKVCAKGSGLTIDENTYVMGWPKGGKSTGKVQYIFVRGTPTWEGISEQVFNALEDGAGAGFIAFDEGEWIGKIGDLYMSFGSGE